MLFRSDQCVLIEFTGQPEFVSQTTRLTQAGYKLHGVVGIVDGKVETAANDPLDMESAFNMGRAARMFGCLVKADVSVDRLRQKLTAGDSADWLQALWNLEDDRERPRDN